jgi:hypothetical protein
MTALLEVQMVASLTRLIRAGVIGVSEATVETSGAEIL